METLYKVFVSIIPPVVGILVYVLTQSENKNNACPKCRNIA